MDSFKPIHIVSLAVVAYNEESTLGLLLDDIVQQDFPHERLEVLLIDSMSSDSTKAIMEEFAQANDRAGYGFLRVRVLSNPGKFLPAGCNVMLDNFIGDAVVRIDGHARIPADFLSQGVAVLDEGEAVAGGPRPTVVEPPSDWGTTLLLAEESAFGSSIADYRKSSTAKYVDAAFHAMFRREAVEATGHYDERLVRTEDNDFFYRLRCAGYRIRFDHRIHSTQHARNTLRKMLKQKYGNGYWIGRTMYIQPKCFHLFHFAPFALVVGAILVALIGVFATWLPFFVCAGLYVALCVGLALKVALQCKDKSADLFALPFVFIGIHLSYGWGTLRGLIEGLFAEKGSSKV